MIIYTKQTLAHGTYLDDTGNSLLQCKNYQLQYQIPTSSLTQYQCNLFIFHFNYN